MDIGILQTDIRWMDAPANRTRIEQMIATDKGGDLYVLPEMFSTGFCMNPEKVAEPVGGETLCWMKRMAEERDCAIAGSLSVVEEGNYYNRFYFVCPDGQVYHADKRHLFSYGGEQRKYMPGNQRVIVDWRGFRFLLLVCYDLRFPVWSRCRKDYDAILYVANWPASRRTVWDVLLRARALENQCYVIGVNRVGNDPLCEYDGGSVIIDPYGKTLAACPDREAASVWASLDREKLERFRQHFPVLDDADCWTLG